MEVKFICVVTNNTHLCTVKNWEIDSIGESFPERSVHMLGGSNVFYYGWTCNVLV